MSSPNHPTSDIEDTFSSNFLNYISASSEYFPTSQGNTSFDSNSSGLVPIALLALLLFHDDPYMKVMQAYNATDNESPISLPRALIAPPTILPPSPVLPLSPKFDPQDFFLPKEILPPRKQAYFLSLPSTDLSAQPQAFEIGEDIQNVSQEDINICSTSHESGCHRQLIDDCVAAALEAQAVNMANADNTIETLNQEKLL
nr:hypothetical protein [Tanacetum cinerariifolium]